MKNWKRLVCLLAALTALAVSAGAAEELQPKGEAAATSVQTERIVASVDPEGTEAAAASVDPEGTEATIAEESTESVEQALAVIDPEKTVATPNTATVVAAASYTAIPSNNRVFLNGDEVYPEAYKISGNNYYKLRDLAYMMIGKTCGFNVEWNPAKSTVNLLPGKSYVSVGGEMKKAAATKTLTVGASTSVVTLSGKTVSIKGYNINGNNYYKLRDAGDILDFDVDYDSEKGRVIIDTNEPEPPVIDTSEPETPAVPVRTSQIDGKMTVIIDAGHGGSDQGASNDAYDLDEKHVNLYVAERLKDKLEANGVTVIMVRESLEEGSSLYLRGDVMDQYVSSVDLFFGLHHNAATGSASGSQILAQIADEDGGPSKLLAQELDKEYEKLGLDIRPIWFREGDRGDYYYTNRYAASLGITAVISEFCFIDNDDDVKYIDSEADWDAEAQAQCNAILNYFAQVEY